MRAGLALELAAGGDLVGLAATALGANCFAIGFRPAHLAEGLIGGILAALVDRLEAQGARSCRKKEVRGHCTISVTLVTYVVR